MGHSCTIFEQRPQLGGMLRYGIPDYRLPPEILDRDISHILWTGIDVHTGISIGRMSGSKISRKIMMLFTLPSVPTATKSCASKEKMPKM